MFITLNVITKNARPVNAQKVFYVDAINKLSLNTVILGSSFLALDYEDFTPITNRYVVSESIQTIDELINEDVISIDGSLKAFDYDVDGNLVYLGKAIPGSSQGEPVWQISKFIYDVDNNLISILWANGNTLFENIWNNRVSYTYS